MGYNGLWNVIIKTMFVFTSEWVTNSENNYYYDSKMVMTTGYCRFATLYVKNDLRIQHFPYRWEAYYQRPVEDIELINCAHIYNTLAVLFCH